MVKMGILLLEINEHLRRRVERDRRRKELPLRQIILALARDVLNLVEGGLQNPSFPRRGEPRHGFLQNRWNWDVQDLPHILNAMLHIRLLLVQHLLHIDRGVVARRQPPRPPASIKRAVSMTSCSAFADN